MRPAAGPPHPGGNMLWWKLTRLPIAMLPARRSASVLAGLAVLAASAFAAGPGQELHIYSSGEAHLVNAEVTTRHALNLFSVKVWGQRWSFEIDSRTKLESAYGAKIEAGQIETGHRLELRGRPIADQTNLIAAALIRDLSILTGTPPPPASPPPPHLAPPPPPPPPPSASNQASALGALRQVPALAKPTPVPAKPPPAKELAREKPPAEAAPKPAEAKQARPQLTQTLRRGMRGPEVALLQEFLQEERWGIPDDGPVSGYFGAVTEQALRRFQAGQGLAPEGEAGPKTRAIINVLLKSLP